MKQAAAATGPAARLSTSRQQRSRKMIQFGHALCGALTSRQEAEFLNTRVAGILSLCRAQAAAANGLAACLSKSGRREEALPLYRRALKHSEHLMSGPQGHRATLAALSALAGQLLLRVLVTHSVGNLHQAPD